MTCCNEMLAQIRDRTGHDATGYKQSTILRRIRRRMQLHQLPTFEEYLGRLREDAGEVDLLFSDVLISVTSFFRDPEVFEALAERVVPAMFAGRGPDDTVRSWSVGCSTGEEAYSLGMLLLEHAAGLTDPPALQIFASDLHERSLQQAREGVYPPSIEADVSAERLERFFVRQNGKYRICQELREMVVFAPHGLLRDPPFSHMDLIVCRNLLIYLQRDTQHLAATVFHYALEPGGHLLLGSSETIDRSDLFTTVDKHLCLFRRREQPGTREPPLPTFMSSSRAAGPRRPRGVRASPAPAAAGHALVHARLLAAHASPSLLIDGDNRIVHFSEFAGPYVTQPGGVPTADVFQLVPDDLRLELRSAVHTARTDHEPTAGRAVSTVIDGEERAVRVHAIPADAIEWSGDDDLDGFVLVVFEETAPDGVRLPAVADERELNVLQALERQLDLTRRRLQTVIEEHETGQEEMRTSNEELQSTNEELRSTMEELETSREELQSMNEELATLNQENRHKVDELGMLSNDLQNLLVATDIATLFLDRQLRIVRFTPPVTAVLQHRRQRPRSSAHRFHPPAPARRAVGRRPAGPRPPDPDRARDPDDRRTLVADPAAPLPDRRRPDRRRRDHLRRHHPAFRGRVVVAGERTPLAAPSLDAVRDGLVVVGRVDAPRHRRRSSAVDRRHVELHADRRLERSDRLAPFAPRCTGAHRTPAAARVG